ncbi:tetratricopeptide repeat protein, partial [Acidobacteria bacterium AH-259-D05]|nr:tetratricopeptide repeat protein [Acidobacteria bacterium AH-259-D05]
MKRILTLFLCPIFSATLMVAQSDQDIEREIQGLITLVRNLEFDRADMAASQLVAAHPYSYQAHMAAFRTHFEAFRNRPDGPNSAQHLEEALKRLNFARRLDPLNYEAWEFALSFWNPARLNPLPQNPQTEQSLGEAEDLFARGDVEKAAKALEQVISREPTYAPAYARLAELYLRDGKYDEALRFSQAATEKDPKDPTGFFLLARAYALLEKGDESVESLISSLEADPGYPPAWQLMTQLDLGGNKVEHMARYFPKAVLWVIDQNIEEA